MQQTDETVKELQQQASAHYLGGRFTEALAAWKRILEVAPDDERALEGVQLCSLLTERTATDTVSVEPEPSDEPVAGVAEAEAEGIEDLQLEVPEFEIDLPPAAGIPDPDRQSEGIDFGDEPEALSLAGDRPEPDDATAPPAVDDGAFEPSEMGATDFDFSDPEEEDMSPAFPSAEAEERVKSLFSDARAAIDRDDREFAREALERLFALDPSYAPALQLQELLESQVPTSDGRAGVDAIADPDHAAAPGEFDLDLDDPEAVEPAPGAASSAVADEAVEDLDLLESVAPVETVAPADEPEEFAAEETEAAAAARFDTSPPPRKGISRPQRSLGSPLVRIAMLAVVVVGGFFGVRALFGGGSSADPEAAVASVDPVPAPGADAVPAAAPPADPQPAPVEAEPQEPQVVMPDEDIDTLLVRADAAARAGDYAAAVVSFNEVLKVDPNHATARRRLEETSEAYREQQALADKWQTAISTFKNGSFRDALRQFYRLPGGAEGTDPKLERYKVNAWYNLGVEALRTTRCSEARDHFDEVASIEPGEFGLPPARALVEQCFANPQDPQFRRTVAAIQLRGLND